MSVDTLYWGAADELRFLVKDSSFLQKQLRYCETQTTRTQKNAHCPSMAKFPVPIV